MGESMDEDMFAAIQMRAKHGWLTEARRVPAEEYGKEETYRMTNSELRQLLRDRDDLLAEVIRLRSGEGGPTT